MRVVTLRQPGQAAAGSDITARDPRCLIWLRHPSHVCQTGGEAFSDGKGSRCAVWARVEAARRQEANISAKHRQYQMSAEEAALGLMAAARQLLEAWAARAGDHEDLAAASAGAAMALLRAEQLAALAGWQ